MIDKLECAQRLINVVCGEPYGDGMTVTNVGVGYAEPGYHDKETVWVLGNWNDKCHHEELPGGGIKWITDSNAPSRLANALERIGVEIEWCDEWYQCDNCQGIVRCSSDSYMWKPYYVMSENCEVLCGDCAVDDDFIDETLEEFINNYHRVVTFVSKQFLIDRGWVVYNDQPYENGWHPGQDARPETVAKEIEEKYPDHDWLFILDENSQFYSRFSAMITPKEQEED